VNQLVATGVLENLGYEVEVAGDGLAALETLEASRFDAVLMDCQMPVMDGFEATRALRAREGAGARTPVIAMTAGAFRDDRERCLQAGMDDHVAKPVTPSALSVVLRRWVAAPALDRG
jgi:two-component system, sensor histidine kinase and response regulator